MTEPPSSPALLPGEKGARIQSPSPWGEGFRVRAKLPILTEDSQINITIADNGNGISEETPSPSRHLCLSY
jgi:hypothetical protein